MRDHRPSEACFSCIQLDMYMGWRDHWGSNDRAWPDQARFAWDSFHLYWREHGTHPAFGKSAPMTSDPVEAAFHDAAKLSNEWVIPFPRSAPKLSKELVKPEDMALYEETMGKIAHHVANALVLYDRYLAPRAITSADAPSPPM